MGWHGAARAEQKANGMSDDEREALYDPSFMSSLSPVDLRRSFSAQS